MRILRTLLPAGAVALLLGVASCSSGGTVRSPATLPMQQHWEAGQALQSAMALGDLATARRAAAAIAEVEDIPGLSWDAGPYLMRVRTEASIIERADHFTDAVTATGRMAIACGACHTRSEDGPNPQGRLTPPTEEGIEEAHMASHGWALDRMWEGLVMPSTDRWLAGARLLAEQPVSAMGLPAEVGLFAASVHEQSRQALEDRDPEDRARRFSGILGDCANCHAELGLQ